MLAWSALLYSQWLTQRAAIAVAIAVTASLYVVWFQSHLSTHSSDFKLVWEAARAWRSGFNPYEVVGHGKPYEFDYPLLYPFPAVLLAVPFSYLPLWAAEGIFVALSMGWLTWTLTRDRLAAPSFWVFGTFAMIAAVQYGQWSPSLTAAALTPSMAWLLVMKPSIGLPLFLAYPSRTAAIGCTLALGLSVVVSPGWVQDWLALIRSPDAAHVTPVVLLPGGFLLLLAALKWRRTDARLLLALSVIPHHHVVYDVVPLCLVISCMEEGMILAAGTVLYRALVAQFAPVLDDDAVYALNAKLLTWCIYLPCLVMVLRRPSEAENLQNARAKPVSTDEQGRTLIDSLDA